MNQLVFENVDIDINGQVYLSMKALTFNSTSVSSENVLFSISMLQTPLLFDKDGSFGLYGRYIHTFLDVKPGSVSIFTVIENKTYVRKNLGART